MVARQTVVLQSQVLIRRLPSPQLSANLLVGCHLGWHMAADWPLWGATEENITKKEPLVHQKHTKKKKSNQLRNRKWNHKLSNSITRVVRILWVPTKRSRDILHQAKGITLIESTQIRWFSRWAGGGGWPSRAKLSGGQESQTKGQGTVWLPLKWAIAEAARQGPEGQIKDYSYDILLTEKRWSTRGAKGSGQTKAPRLKRKMLTLGSRICCCGMLCCWCWWRCRWLRTRHANHKSIWQRFGVWGLNLKNGVK